MNLLRCLLFLFVPIIAGCTLPTHLVQTIPESHLLVHMDDTELFAVRPDGEMIAYVADGLHILRLSDSYHQQLTFDNPDALIWTPDGSALVVAFRESEKTRLVRLSSSTDDRPQTFVDEQITDFAWLADGRLLAMGQTVENDSGFLELSASLLLWNGQWDVEKIPLYSQSFQHYSRYDDPVVHHFDLSPLKDELIFNRYLDPPVPDGRIELVLYNLQTGRELVLAETDNRLMDAFCSADGEIFLITEGYGVVQLLNPWTNKIINLWQSAGESLQIAPFQNLLYVDGSLYAGDRQQLELPERAKVQFSENGERMFVAWQRKLYLYSNYEVPGKTQYTGVEKVKLQRIRQQRSLGEISIRDYYQQRNNILNR